MAKEKDEVQEEQEVLTTQNDEVQTKDEEINEVGEDAPVVEQPMVKVKDAKVKDPAKVHAAAIRHLARRVLGTAEVDEFQSMFPSLYEE